MYACDIESARGSDRLDVIETAKVFVCYEDDRSQNTCSAHNQRGTSMADEYLAGKLQLVSMEEYIERVILFGISG